jgi:hypothetical protein
MQYMVIEQFKNARMIYGRLRNRGRLMPDDLRYLNSWVSADLTRCFQLMETDREDLFREWIANWSDVMEFEVVPVVSSAEAREAALGEDHF